MDIVIKNLNKSYGEKTIFKNFEITFKEKEVNTIVGKSGCGKTTLLKIISGMENKDGGEIEGADLGSISYIFQEDRLIDWLTVEENIEFVLKNDYNKQDVKKICEKYLKMVGIEEYRNFYPQKLSGGLRQRVNIARALSKPSKLIIMDEPFKSIDIINKMDIMSSFKSIISREKRTVLFVTHDIEESVYFDGFIYVLGESPVTIKKYYINIEDNLDIREEIKEDIIKTI
jgi:NitT/TauT family transport system ATP-binding protein